jgi:hypothetical protein
MLTYFDFLVNNEDLDIHAIGKIEHLNPKFAQNWLTFEKVECVVDTALYF